MHSLPPRIFFLLGSVRHPDFFHLYAFPSFFFLIKIEAFRCVFCDWKETPLQSRVLFRLSLFHTHIFHFLEVGL
jgi:hypothetical protein